MTRRDVEAAIARAETYPRWLNWFGTSHGRQAVDDRAMLARVVKDQGDEIRALLAGHLTDAQLADTEAIWQS